jgi:3-deoxy-D-manno-octulosonic-acid transferase
MLVECRRSGVPVAVVNARISDRSWPRYLRLRFLWRRLLNGLSLAMAQSELDAERLCALGASNVIVGGNLKYDIRVAQPAAVTERLRSHLPGGAKVVVCGSTMEGEEELLADSLPRDAVVILAPRHPERFDVAAAMLAKRGLPLVRRSEWVESPTDLSPGMFFLLDSIGELASVYSLASVAYVGGGMFVPGGHNPLEPAQYGVPVVMGPHYENFREIVEKLRAADAVAIAEASELRQAMRRMIDDQEAATEMGLRARGVFESEAGATARTVAALIAVLEERA